MVERKNDMARMVVKIFHGIHGDGFNVDVIRYSGGVHTYNFYYGYNASHSREVESDKAPYTTDIIDKLMREYDVQVVEVASGYNEFMKRCVNKEEIDRFISKYLTPADIIAVNRATVPVDDVT